MKIIIFLSYLIAGGLSAYGAVNLDFNGDGKSDFAVIRGDSSPTSQMQWFVTADGATAIHFAVNFGLFNSDVAVPCDYDGDGKTDIAVWRPEPPSGDPRFYILQSTNLQVRVEEFGRSGDNPKVVGDYDGDGKCDVAVYRRGQAPGEQSYWFYRGSFNNPQGHTSYIPWGSSTDTRPIPGDFDGDGKYDFTIARNSGGTAEFWTLRSTGGFEINWFGSASDFVVPYDFDGDGRADIAMVRNDFLAGVKYWFIRQSSDGAIRYQIQYGEFINDAITPGDYDGDGKTDISIMRRGAMGSNTVFWYNSSANPAMNFVIPWGQTRLAGDYPLVNTF